MTDPDPDRDVVVADIMRSVGRSSDGELLPEGEEATSASTEQQQPREPQQEE
jgi:hypothetical protein